MGLSENARVAVSNFVEPVDGVFKLSGDEIREVLSVGVETGVFELQDHPDILVQIHNVKLRLRELALGVGDDLSCELFANGIELVGIAPEEDGRLDAERTNEEIDMLNQYWETGERTAVLFDVTFYMPEWEESVTVTPKPLNLHCGDFGGSSSGFELCEGFDVDEPGSVFSVHSFRVSTDEGLFKE